jgi:hypothetical protein
MLEQMYDNTVNIVAHSHTLSHSDIVKCKKPHILIQTNFDKQVTLNHKWWLNTHYV